MSECNACSKAIARQDIHKLQCSKCKKLYHAKCSELKDDALKQVKGGSRVWCCRPCESEAGVPEGEIGAPSLSEIYKLIQTVKTDLERDLGKSLELAHEKLDENSALLKTQADIISACLQKIERLEDENVSLRKQLRETNLQLDEVNQYGRRNTVEIYGVPESPNEDPFETVRNVGHALDLKVEPEMIDTCHRLKKAPHQTSSGIIVKFVRRADKDTFLQRRKVKRTLNTGHLGLPSRDPIYINQSLTPYRKNVYAQARRIKREKNFAFLWVDNNGAIKLRKQEGDKHIYVLNCPEDVSALV